MFGTVLQSQIRISDIETEKLIHKKVLKYLNKSNYCFFNELQPSVNENSDLSMFYVHHAIYTVFAPIENIWNTCMFVSPTNLWKGKILDLSFVYNNNSDKLSYKNDQNFDSLEINQIYFINLHIMHLFNVAAALITTKIDYEEKVLEFTYIKGNKSIGKQIVRLIVDNENETKIIHDTYYKSDSKFRDKRLYPRFHQKSITDLHKKIDLYSNPIEL